jgi:ankyrin repeat protein
MLRTVIVLAVIVGIVPSAVADSLHDAARQGDLATTKTLLAGSAKIDERGTDGDTRL